MKFRMNFLPPSYFQSYLADDPEEDLENELEFNGYFANLNATVSLMEGRNIFYSQMGFKMLDSMVVDIFTTVPAIDGGWIKTGGQGTDPFFNWGLHWSPLKECLSVLRIMSSPAGVFLRVG